MKTDLILGTAMWGWTMEQATAFELLDAFYQAGYRKIDAATNYPINKNPDDFRHSEKILETWINTNGISDLKIIMKVGSLNNMRTPDHNLTKSFLLMNLDEYHHRFGSNLQTYMIHWDNRDKPAEIRASLEAFQIAHEQGIQPGLSGIRHPDIYAILNQEFGFSFQIEMKHNLLYSDYTRYAPLHDQGHFLAYGINVGGLKLKTTAYTNASSLKARGGKTDTLHPIAKELQKLVEKHPQKLSSFNDCGMVFAAIHPEIRGILIGPSRLKQLENTLAFHQKLQGSDYTAIYQELQTLSSQHG